MQLEHYDSVIIGAGHNGMVCASYLAKAGQKVLVLEAAEQVGGLAAQREFHPGFRAPVAHSADRFSKKIASDLKLHEHGLAWNDGPQALLTLMPEGKSVELRDGQLTGVNSSDQEAYTRLSAQLGRFSDALAPFWLKSIPRIAPGGISEMLTFGQLGLNLRRLGKTDLREFLRMFSLPMRDLADENFTAEPLKALLSWDGLIGSRMAPRSPNNAVLTLLYRMAGNSVAGGTGALTRALETALKSSGAELRTGARIEQITIAGDADGERATGVQLADGETITADRVVSSTDPQTTFNTLLGAGHLEIGFANRIQRLRCRGLVAKLHLALAGTPAFTGVQNLDGRMLIAPSMDAIEFAFDDAKYGEWSQEPVMEITLPSIANPGLAPAGQHVLSAHAMFVPYELAAGWNEEQRARLTEQLVDRMEAYAPGLRAMVLHQELLTPLDIEREHGVSGGHWHHAEMALDQMFMMRPTYEAAQYRTPVPGLWLCGAGCHPGGDLTGAPGHNAAREILK